MSPLNWLDDYSFLQTNEHDARSRLVGSSHQRAIAPWDFYVSMYGICEDKVKSSSLAYNRRETRDKRPLGRDPDRSWCHLHTNVKLSLSQLMDTWTERQDTPMLPPMSMEP